MDAHDDARSLIARALASEVTESERRRLDEHFEACAECEREMDLAARAVRGLGGFSFAVDPGSIGRVQAALARRAAELAAERAGRRRSLVSFAAALLMTACGSAAVWRWTGWFAASRHLAPAAVEAALAVFWVLPSLCAALILLAPRAIAERARAMEAAP